MIIGTSKCPKCGSTKLWNVNTMIGKCLECGYESKLEVVPDPVFAEE